MPIKDIQVTSSMEDYLEAIALIKVDKRIARVKDISRFLKVKKPSVSEAIRNLVKNGLVMHERYGDVRLTAAGEKIARNVKKRHQVLLRFLSDVLGIDPETASNDACKIEHHISQQTFVSLIKFIEPMGVKKNINRNNPK